MKVIFSAEFVALWLNHYLAPEVTEQLARQQGLGADACEWHPVSKLVDNVRNDGPELSQPLKQST